MVFEGFTSLVCSFDTLFSVWLSPLVLYYPFPSSVSCVVLVFSCWLSAFLDFSYLPFRDVFPANMGVTFFCLCLFVFLLNTLNNMKNMQICNVRDRNYMPRQARAAVQSRVDRIWLTELTGGKKKALFCVCWQFPEHIDCHGSAFFIDISCVSKYLTYLNTGCLLQCPFYV